MNEEYSYPEEYIYQEDAYLIQESSLHTGTDILPEQNLTDHNASSEIIGDIIGALCSDGINLITGGLFRQTSNVIGNLAGNIVGRNLEASIPGNTGNFNYEEKNITELPFR